jgi:catechol 2,3-dioxygenase-like lactoylglutathione lyase family enzyme
MSALDESAAAVAVPGTANTARTVAHAQAVRSPEPAHSPETYALIPYVHVADLARSIAFYDLLGFTLEQTHDADGTTVWASLRNEQSRLFLILADAPIDAGAQAVLFYLWTANVRALRERLVAGGLRPSTIEIMPYMRGGEMRLSDPDGYALLIGQREA